MSHQTFQDMWAECVMELMEQVQIEHLQADAQDQGTSYDIGFEHNSLLYIKYMQIYTKLEMCYDQMAHPQKRRDVKKLLQTVVVRILELKEQLIVYNRRPQNHIVPLDEVLTDLKLNPETVDWQVPRYFIDDQDIADEIEMKRQKIEHWMRTGKGNDEPDDLMSKKDPFQVDLTLEQAIRIIQKNERGRIGIVRAQLLSEWRKDAMRKEERNKRASDKDHEDPFDQQVFAATMIAAHWKKRVDRKRFQKMREEEFEFLGMAKPPALPAEVDQVKLVQGIRLKRKKMQQDHEEEFAKEMQNATNYVRDKRGPDIIARHKLECREWILEERQKHEMKRFPESIAGMREAPPEEGAVADDAAKGAQKTDAKGKPVEEEIPVMKTGTTDAVLEILKHINDYTTMWEGRGDRANFEDPVDIELARKEVYPRVEAEIKKIVDQEIENELKNLINLYQPAKGKKGKAGGGKKKKGGKAGGKKGKKKNWVSKAVENQYTSDDACVSDLAMTDHVLLTVAPAYFKDFVGEFAYMGQVQRVQEPFAVAPSAQMVKSMIIEHCVLPLASLHIRQRVKPEMCARSLLIYGPRGTGKSMLARCIATETGAAFFNLSPSVIEGKYTTATHGKTGTDLLIYKVFMVAQYLAAKGGPSIIYIDHVEQVFRKVGGGGKKKKGGGGDPDGPFRLKKILQKGMNQIMRGPESEMKDRILVIGVTDCPFDRFPADYGDLRMRGKPDLSQRPPWAKDMMDSFDFKVWCSFPDCGSRALLIRKFIEAKGVVVDPAKLNISALSIAADGYSAGSLKQTATRVLTSRRIQQLKNRPLQVDEFLGPLSRTDASWPEDWLAFRAFDHEASGEKDRIENYKEKLTKLEGGDDKAKKK